MMTQQQAPRLRARRTARGFSLIEIMVGLVIAMMGVIIMMQVLIDAEERGRTTSTGNDAFSNGAITMHLLQKDLHQAGFGINTLNLLEGCTVTLPSGAVVPLAPVTINPADTLLPTGWDANTDRLLIVYGNDSGQPEGNKVFAVAGTNYSVQAPAAFRAGDRVVGFPGSCAAALTLGVVSATDGMAGTVTVDAATAGATVLYNLGSSPRIVGYRVRNGSLESCDYMGAANCTTNGAHWAAVAGNIVSLQALYGRDTTGPADGVPTTWDQATPTTGCGWMRTPSLRLAMVARSTQYESRLNSGTGQRECDPVTTAAPKWNGSTPINISGSGADWQCYRYKTFENIAPTRNVVWMTDSSC